MNEQVKTIMQQLAAPFTTQINGKTYPDLKWLPKDGKSMSGKIICFPYITRAQVIKRLNEVMGINGWQFQSRLEPDGTRTGTLSLFLGSEWISKDGVGTQSREEKEKGADSDSLKRCAVGFGIGLYLNDMPAFFIKSKPNKSGKATPCDNNGKLLYGDQLHAYINGYSTSQGLLMQIFRDNPELWKKPEYKKMFYDLRN